jgi:hypothetical protein
MPRKLVLLLTGAAASLLRLEAALVAAFLPQPPEGPAALVRHLRGQGPHVLNEGQQLTAAEGGAAQAHPARKSAP